MSVAWAIVRHIPLVRRPFWRAAQARAQRDALVAETTAHRDAAAAILHDIAISHQNLQPRKGRNVKAGNRRGWNIEFGGLLEHAKTLPDYQAALAACEGCSLVGEPRLLNLYLIVKFGLADLPGDLVEFGAYQGGSALFLASLLKSTGQSRVIYACDTFAGMPETNPDIDMHRAGDFSDVSYDTIMDRAQSLGLDQHLVLVKGRFEDTLPDLRRNKRFALVHVDCDIHDAICFVLDDVHESLVPGAYVIFDDPLYSSCLGAMEAVEEIYIQRRCLFSEQVYPHLVFRPKGLG